jgi:hypothetical protein
VGDEFRIVKHTVNAGDNAYLLGNTGEGQIWDYDSIPFSTTIDTTKLLNPSTHPDYAMFPTSNLLIENSGGNMFLNKTTGQVDLVGIYADMNGTVIKDTLGNPWTVLKFPMAVGSAFKDSGATNIDAQINGSPGRVKMRYYVDSKIDAGGTVKTPTGSYQCVREKRIERTGITVFTIILGQEISVYNTVDTAYKYNFWTKDKKWNVIEIETDKNDVIKNIGYLQ